MGRLPRVVASSNPGLELVNAVGVKRSVSNAVRIAVTLRNAVGVAVA